MFDASRDFISPTTARLTVEQHQLRQRQDTIRVAPASSRQTTEWRKLSALHERVCQRLSEIRREKQAEVSRVAGTKAQWRALERELQRPFEEFASDGRLSRQLLQSFEATAKSHILAGDARVAALILAAVINSTCTSPRLRREDIQ